VLTHTHTRCSDRAHDVQFTNTFLYAYRTFATPDELLLKFEERFAGGDVCEVACFTSHAFAHTVPPSMEENVAFIVQTRVCIALKNWLELCVSVSPDLSLDSLERVRSIVVWC
jgi:hypothetical protein